MKVLHHLITLLQSIVDELWLNVAASFKPDSLELRLKRLRQMYYHDSQVSLSHRRVRDVLRGHLEARYHEYYERLLTAERAVYQLTRDLHSGARGDELLEQVQALGEKIVRLVEQLQHADQVATLYDAHSEEASMMADSRAWLEARLEEALEIQKGIPARVMNLKTVAASRGVEKLGERIARLTTRLDDIADSYAEVDGHLPEHQRALLDDDAS